MKTKVNTKKKVSTNHKSKPLKQGAVMGWVAMKDKTPPDMVEFYLTYNCLGEYKILEWYEGSCFMWCTDGHWSNDDGEEEQGITHWMPLPPCL